MTPASTVEGRPSARPFRRSLSASSFGGKIVDMRYLSLSLLIAAMLATTACAGKSSDNSSSDQSSATATSAATDSSGSAASAAPSASSDTGGIPSYPGATTQAAGSSNSMGKSASGSVMTTDDSFDKVYQWYQQNMPAGSEKSHTTAPMQMAVFTLGDPSSGQKSVTITTSGGKTMITIGSVKSQ
jgi:hypothetical protein